MRVYEKPPAFLAAFRRFLAFRELLPLRQEPERELLRAAVAQQPDVTLAELQGLRGAGEPRGEWADHLPGAARAPGTPQKKVFAPRNGTKSNGRSFASSCRCWTCVTVSLWMRWAAT